jgi:hypothetical protein
VFQFATPLQSIPIPNLKSKATKESGQLFCIDGTAKQEAPADLKTMASSKTSSKPISEAEHF